MSPSGHLLTQVSLPVLRRLDAERAHDLGLTALRWLQPLWTSPSVPAGLAVEVAGLKFAHPVGLAAGFDKNGDYLDALGALGFSHVELGTVTPRPQAGNPKPRMFRHVAARALVNRMGFNNKGADHLVEQLGRSTYRGVRGISIGKNADTPLEDAARDYVIGLQKVYERADYVAINVSSPNTARLRELQERDGLERIVGALLDEREPLQARYGRRAPLFVKVAPDLDGEQLQNVAASLKALTVDGVIATNTTIDLTPLGAEWPAEQRGGLSGAPLHSRSLGIITQLRRALGPDMPIVGVGGIFSAEHALASLKAGANLLQIYTGFAYRGPVLLEEILTALARGAA